MSTSDHDPIEQLNGHHADDLVVIARTFGGHPDATRASAERVDYQEIALRVETPNGPVSCRVPFLEPVDASTGFGAVRVAFVRLARRARAASS